jgi:branched-chain amino acid transport system permease protein
MGLIPTQLDYIAGFAMRRLLTASPLLIALSAGGCAGIDADQLDLCRRAVGALHPDGTELRELRYGDLPSQRLGVHIDYAAREPGQDRRIHAVDCEFAGPGRGERLDLEALDVDGHALGDARLLFLKRFWLAVPHTGETIALTRGPLPELPGAIAYAAQQGINALVLAAIYGLLATAYSLIYGLVGRLNLAFGEMAVLGAFGAIGGVGAGIAAGLRNALAGLIVALMFAAFVASLWSWFIGRTVVAPLHARYRLGQPILIATIAAAVAIQEFLRLSQGVREHWLPPTFSEPISLARAGDFTVTVTPMQLTIASAAIAAALAVLWLFARTRFGRNWRAFADDPGAAALFGVSGERLLAAAFLLAGLNAGLAGWIVAVYYGNVSSAMGTVLGLKALVAAVLGGIGRIEGAFLGGIVIGLIEAVWSAYFDIASRDLVLFSLLIVIFVLRPGGLLGLAEPTPRQV